jgi:guanylate kinase
MMPATPLSQVQRRGLLLVVSSPSGGGKSAVLERLLEHDRELVRSVSVTTRPPRPGEADGRDYHFVTRARFEEMIKSDAFYEWAEVHGNLYGTRADTIAEALAAGRDVALAIDVQGAQAVKHRSPEAVLVFIVPPSLEVLEQRLRGRATDDETQIQIRLANARRELERQDMYDYVVLNDRLEEAVAALARILDAERRKRAG